MTAPTTDRDGEYWRFRRLVERVLADIDADHRDALRRCPSSGCAYCGTTHADPIVLGWDREVPAWTAHAHGDLCSTCEDSTLGLQPWEAKARFTARLLDIGSPNVVPIVRTDPLVLAGREALPWFHELPHAQPTASPWAHVDRAALRAAYDAASTDDEPPYETADPCPACGTPDRWLRIPFRQEFIERTRETIEEATGAKSEPVFDELLVIDHPEHLECGRCRTLQVVTPRQPRDAA